MRHFKMKLVDIMSLIINVIMMTIKQLFPNMIFTISAAAPSSISAKDLTSYMNKL